MPENTTNPPAEAAKEATGAPDAEQKYREAHDRLLRLAAEFDNWKKRASRDLGEAVQRARDDVLVELLPVLDGAERALAEVRGDDPVAKGMRLLYRQLLGVAGKLGIERIDPVGERFDPRLHHAIAELETAEMPPGTVAQVHTPGYRHGGRLLRPAMVTVAAPPRLPAEGEPDEAR